MTLNEYVPGTPFPGKIGRTVDGSVDSFHRAILPRDFVSIRCWCLLLEEV